MPQSELLLAELEPKWIYFTISVSSTGARLSYSTLAGKCSLLIGQIFLFRSEKLKQ